MLGSQRSTSDIFQVILSLGYEIGFLTKTWGSLVRLPDQQTLRVCLSLLP